MKLTLLKDDTNVRNVLDISTIHVSFFLPTKIQILKLHINIGIRHLLIYHYILICWIFYYSDTLGEYFSVVIDNWNAKIQWEINKMEIKRSINDFGKLTKTNQQYKQIKSFHIPIFPNNLSKKKKIRQCNNIYNDIKDGI